MSLLGDIVEGAAYVGGISGLATSVVSDKKKDQASTFGAVGGAIGGALGGGLFGEIAGGVIGSLFADDEDE